MSTAGSGSQPPLGRGLQRGLARGWIRGLAAVLGVSCLAAQMGISTAAHAEPACPSGTPLAGMPARTAAHSEQASRTLGGRLDAAAARVGLSSAELRAEFASDPTLWVDPCGSPNYRDAGADAAPSDAAEMYLAAVPPADAFSLHSMPGAARTIYLDFDGHYISGTEWRDGAAWTAPAFDRDSKPGTFSDSERATVIAVWERVADDYAPFAVDVTTEDPGLPGLERTSAADQIFGTRVLISPDRDIAAECGCGGWAYLDVFDSVSALRYQPAWVLPQSLGWSAKNIAEAASHEAGHNLSLKHDGRTTPAESYYRGSDGWAPIMGVSYYENTSQWSRGEYPNANNSENDTTLIAASGAPLRSDDVGNTAATATPLVLAVPTTGRITTASDTDWYSITASGRISVSARPNASAPDLDIALTLTDAGGKPLATADPPYSTTGWPDSAAALLTYTAPAATSLRIKVDGAGNGIAGSNGSTDYGSLGTYTLLVTTDGLSATLASPPAMTVGRPVELPLTASGGQAPVTWTVAAGALPPGLSVAGTQITGTPTTPGTCGATLQVTDGAGASSSVSLTFVVAAQPTITSAQSNRAVVGSAVSVPLTADFGVPPLHWTLAGLPPGLSSDPDSIVGSPTVAGTYAVTARVSDANGAVAEKSLTFQVVYPLAIAEARLEATVGTALSYRIVATGGWEPFTWAAGGLPPGLTQDAAWITGTPTEPGAWTVAVTATDAIGIPAQQQIIIVVSGAPAAPAAAAPVVPAPAAHPQTAPPAATPGVQALALQSPTTITLQRGKRTDSALTATGGTGTYRWKRSSGKLPRGTKLTTAGHLIGKPTKRGTYRFTVRVTDSSGARVTGRYLVLVS